MATIQKLTVTRWYLPDRDHPKGRREVKPGTLGAEKVREEGATYFVVWKEGGQKRREATGLSDKRAATKYLADWLTARERGQQGLTDPFKVHLDRDPAAHLGDYLTALRARSRSAYPDEVNRELSALFSALNATTLRDLTAPAIRKHLDRMTAAARTRNLLRTYAVGFFNYLVGAGCISANPITKHTVPTYKDTDRDPRRRRAMTPAELRGLVNAVRDYPILARSKNRGGRPRKDGTPARSLKPVTLSDAYRATLTQTGRERHLLYRVAILTGLRRGELSRLKVSHLFTEKNPRIDTTQTKNKRRAVIPIPSTLAADLSTWIKDTNRKPGDRLLTVPNRSNLLARVHRPGLKLANVAYQTADGFADFHSLRKSLNTFLRRKGISLALRQRVLRHAAGDLATKHYDDERLAEMRPVVSLLTKLDRYLTSTPTAPTTDTPGM